MHCSLILQPLSALSVTADLVIPIPCAEREIYRALKGEMTNESSATVIRKVSSAE